MCDGGSFATRDYRPHEIYAIEDFGCKPLWRVNAIALFRNIDSAAYPFAWLEDFTGALAPIRGEVICPISVRVYANIFVPGR